MIGVTVYMNITVYLGANEGNDPGLRKAVEELGTWIGSSGNALVYGGSRSGLMGAIADSGDAFIAFPGGTGTLEEITEVMSKVSLKHLDAPCILYNLNGYYNALQALLEQMIEKGLSSEERQAGIYFAGSLEEIRHILSLA